MSVTTSAPFPIAIVGVGNMGAGMARRLLSLGWPVQVCDLDVAKTRGLEPFGAIAHEYPAQVAINSIVTVVAVVDAAQTESVLFGAHGIAHVMTPGQTVLLCPTLAPQDVERFARRLNAMGLHMIDAPMSGGPQRALDGTLSLMVACEEAVFLRHAGLLAALSNQVFRISERVGDGARTKLVNNLAAGINLVGAAEVLAMARAMGLDLATTQRVIEQSSGQSWIGSDRMRRAIEGDFAPRAHMTLLEKDTRLAVAAAQVAGYEGPLGATARQVFAAACAGGLAGQDDGALLMWLSRGA